LAKPKVKFLNSEEKLMNKRILLVISILMLFGLAIVAFAYNQTNTTNQTAMSCCCKGDSCPMKNKDASASSTASCCDDPNCCCKDGGSCPMKMSGEASQKMSTDVKYENAAAEHKEGCDCTCCAAKKNAGA